MDLGNKARELRVLRHLSQDELARRSGLSRITINRIEKGHINPTATTIEQLAKGLGVYPGTLFEPTIPLGASQLGPKWDIYRFSGEQHVTKEQLAEHGIEVNNSELRVLNQRIDLHKRPALGPVAVGTVKKKDEPVDDERVSTLLAYVLASGMLTEEETEAVRENLERKLVSHE
jgi:transcriptional regulator with XRE-family HTH domain